MCRKNISCRFPRRVRPVPDRSLPMFRARVQHMYGPGGELRIIPVAAPSNDRAITLLRALPIFNDGTPQRPDTHHAPTDPASLRSAPAPVRPRPWNYCDTSPPPYDDAADSAFFQACVCVEAPRAGFGRRA